MQCMLDQTWHGRCSSQDRLISSAVGREAQRASLGISSRGGDSSWEDWRKETTMLCGQFSWALPCGTRRCQEEYYGIERAPPKKEVPTLPLKAETLSGLGSRWEKERSGGATLAWPSVANL